MSGSSVRLHISMGEEKVGELMVNSQTNQMGFEYDDNWKLNGFEISPHIPFSNATKASGNISMFVENLLPEDENRELLAAYTGVSKTSIFGLIRKIGQETTGALRFSDQFPVVAGGPIFRPISKEELVNRLDQNSSASLVNWDEKPRLSVAGVQRKLPVVIREGEMGLGDGSLCSTHILKFQDRKVRELSIVFNEYLCMKLAELCQLEVATVEYQKIGEHPVLVVKRFDRIYHGVDFVERLHIIDGCQMLNLPLSHKYERPYGDSGNGAYYRDGVTFGKLYSALSGCHTPMMDRVKIIRWLMFNLIIGNTDFHGKNISFFTNHQGAMLTPFYDLLNTSIYSDKYNTGLAFNIGDEFKLCDVQAYQLVDFCEEHGISRQIIKSELSKLAKVVIERVDGISTDELSLDQHEVLFKGHLIEDIKSRATRLLKAADEILAVTL